MQPALVRHQPAVPLPSTGIRKIAPVPDPGRPARELAARFRLEVPDAQRFVADYRQGTAPRLLSYDGQDAYLPALGAFRTWWRRLSGQDAVRISLFAACYQLAEWAATPVWRFSESRVYAPAFPEDWVKRAILGAPSPAPLEPGQSRRFDRLREDWEAGAVKMREILMAGLHQAYTENAAQVLSFPCFEDLAKLALMVQSGCRGLTYAASRGFAVANHFYRTLKAEMERRCELSLPGHLIPYPSTRLNYE